MYSITLSCSKYFTLSPLRSARLKANAGKVDKERIPRPENNGTSIRNQVKRKRKHQLNLLPDFSGADFIVNPFCHDDYVVLQRQKQHTQ